MSNHYEVAEIVEIGRAQDVILGGQKLDPVVPDSPDTGFRLPDSQDDE